MHAALLERLLGQYRPEHVSDFSQITVGVSNDAYVVATTSGNRYVIRVIHLQTTESVEAEALIQQAMIRHRLSTPVYLRLDDGRFVGRDGDIRFTIAEYVSGSHPGSVTLGLVRSLGATLARLHDVLDPAEIRLGLNTGQWLHRRNAATDIATCHAPIRHGLQSAFDESAHIYELGLPTAIIHGELATNNVFAEGDRVTTIFDFETARHARDCSRWRTRTCRWCTTECSRRRKSCSCYGLATTEKRGRN